MAKDKPWAVYIVKCKDSSYYTGITNDLKNRIKTHNAGKGALYTKFHRPVRLVFSEPSPNRSEALKREYRIKQLTHIKKKELIKGSKSGKKGR